MLGVFFYCDLWLPRFRESSHSCGQEGPPSWHGTQQREEPKLNKKAAKFVNANVSHCQREEQAEAENRAFQMDRKIREEDALINCLN